MEAKKKTIDTTKCVRCGACQEHCVFLRKYDLIIGQRERLNELSYHCFLCGVCSAVCPVGIDGREVVLSMRKEQVRKDNGIQVNKKYKRTISEKAEYSYRNYRHITEKSVLFPGCNFPSVYPKTTKKLVQILEEKAGIGVVYDCCGKPISDLGMEDAEQTILHEIEQRLHKAGVTELITLCPNCYDYLKPRISIKVIHIYEKLRELGIGQKIAEEGRIFLPCPDREQRIWLRDICTFMEKECAVIEEIQCCGLGGQAGVEEPELAKSFAKQLKGSDQRIYTYCGSCSGHLTRNGCGGVRHVLPEILGTGEKPDTVKSLINRMKTKYL
jgi:Fe-S oxidoreductase